MDDGDGRQSHKKRKRSFIARNVLSPNVPTTVTTLIPACRLVKHAAPRRPNATRIRLAINVACLVSTASTTKVEPLSKSM